MLKGAFVAAGLLLLGAITSCKKDSTNPDGVPNVAVNATINVTSIQNVGGWGTFTGGYKGLLVFCNGPESYLAFDMGCPYDCQTNSKAVIAVLPGNISAKCPVCGTTYSLYGGTVISNGPGTIALKQYSTNYDNPPFLYVSN